MKVLAIHPEDELQGEPWASMKWDRVIDLGLSGPAAYAHAASVFGCQVTGLSEFHEDFREMRRVRELLSFGMGRLVDGFGLDWWELISIEVHQKLESAILLGQMACKNLGGEDEFYVSRDCFQAEVLRFTLGTRVRIFAQAANRRNSRAQRYLRLLRKFPAHQLLEIFWDKTDSGYQIRGLFNIRQRPQPGTIVLLPTSYINVSRTAVAYAESLPDVRFLLVVTRQSGWLKKLPTNVTAIWLRKYASIQNRSRKSELADLLKRWESLRGELMGVREFSILSELKCFDDFPERFRDGLQIRDAWRNVFDREPVKSIICADDSNPSTRIPLLLAKHRGLRALACHHGALDGHNLFKRNHADARLAKGKMEEDYLARICGLPREQVEVGAPALPSDFRERRGRSERSCIVFFSEPYELTGGRARDFYRDILPSLADLALSENRELIVKLHPTESVAERGRMIEQTLNPTQFQVTRLVDGPLQSSLLDKTWFGITGMSTVVVECALRGIPCFLCSWIELGNYGYVDQFVRFDLGILLKDPSALGQIPAILQSYRPNGMVRENCWTPIEAQRLRSLLGMASDPTAEARSDAAKSA
jgi:hypothetical protein